MIQTSDYASLAPVTLILVPSLISSRGAERLNYATAVYGPLTTLVRLKSRKADLC